MGSQLFKLIQKLFGRDGEPAISNKPNRSRPASRYLPSAATEDRIERLKRDFHALLDRQPLEGGDIISSIVEQLRVDFSEKSPTEAAMRAGNTFEFDANLAPIFLYHNNGFIREVAVKALPRRDLGPHTLIELCYRCNDWVPEIRAAARSKFFEALPLQSGETLQLALPILFMRIPSWRRWVWNEGRYGAEDSVDLLEEILTYENVRAAAVERFFESTPGPTSKHFAVLAKQAWLDPYLPRLAFEAHAAGVRRLACRALLAGEIQWPDGYRVIRRPMYQDRREAVFRSRPISVEVDRVQVFRAAAADRSALVRTVAAEELITSGPDAFPVEYWAALRTDKRPSVRGRMEFFQRKWIEGSLPDYLA